MAGDSVTRNLFAALLRLFPGELAPRSSTVPAACLTGRLQRHHRDRTSYMHPLLGAAKSTLGVHQSCIIAYHDCSCPGIDWRCAR